MEVERIQPVQGLRVERTGSESERRRHQRPDEEFAEMLEDSLEDKGKQQGNGGNGANSENAAPAPVAPPLPHDTVSLSSSAGVQAPPVADVLSLSPEALISSQALQASGGELRLSLVQRTALGLRNFIAPAVIVQPAAVGESPGTPAAPPQQASQPPAAPATALPVAPPAPGSLDTLA